MRIIAFAVLLFAAGFGIVAIGQQAFAYFGHGRIEARPGATPITGEARLTETLDDYVVRANRAFATMDRSCSAADRRALGQAFHDLIQASTGPKPVSASAGGSPEPVIFAQVIDASRRGILTSEDFPQGMARTMHIQMKMLQRGDGRGAAAGNVMLTGDRAAFARTRCLPI